MRSTGGASPAEAGAIHGVPTGGYVWSSVDQTLRAIVGVPGATQLGASLVPTGHYITGAAAAGSGAALLVDGTGGLFAMALPSGTPVALANGYSQSTLVRFSPSGTSALAFVPGSAHIVLVTGLPSAPVVHAVVAPAGLMDAALADSGSVLTATAAANGVVVAFARAGAGTPAALAALTTLTRFSGFAFLPGADDALVADSSNHALLVFRALSTSPSHSSIPVATMHDAVAVGASRDGRWAVVVNSGDANVLRVDLSGLSPATSLPCLCQPSVVEPLAGNAVFRVSTPAAVTAGAQAPLWSVDAGASTPRLLFIPARAPAPEAN